MANFERQESVTEDDLFGEGRLKCETTGKKIGGSTDESTIAVTCLPNFSILGLTGIYVESEKDDCSISQSCGQDDELNEKVDKSDVKNLYRRKGSKSTIEGRRKRFSNRSDIEVFEDIYEIPEPDEIHFVRKSNSLPDLILSSSSSSSQSPLSHFRSNFPSFGPEVTHPSGSLSSTPRLVEKRNRKELFEGKSSSKSKDNGSSVYKVQGAGDIILEMADEGFVESKDKESFEHFENEKQDEEVKNAGQRREIFSRSSGYLTGSESKDKSKSSFQSQVSTVAGSEASSEPWLSNDVAKENQDDMANYCNIPHMSGFSRSFGGDNSYKENSGCSASTFVGGLEEKFPNDTINENQSDDTMGFTGLKTESYPEDSSIKLIMMKNGNVPNLDVFNDSSVMVGQSTLTQIEQEDDKKLQQDIRHLNLEGTTPHSIGPRSSISDFSASDRHQLLVLEDCLKAGIDPSIILKKLHGSENSTPSPSPADLSRIVSPGQKFTCTCLQRASRCQKSGCTDDKACIKLRYVGEALEKVILLADSESDMVKQYCQALWQHQVVCDELWCKVKYCQQLPSWGVPEADVKKTMECIQRTLREPVMKVLASDNYTFHQIGNREINKDVKSIIPLSMLGTFGSTVLCLDKAQKMCVVKRAYMNRCGGSRNIKFVVCIFSIRMILEYCCLYALFEDQHQVSVYERLCEKHPYIVEQLWILVHENEIQICSDFMAGGSLCEYMVACGPLTWQKAMIFIQQMLSALTFLHKNGIVYLNWHSSNMMFSDTTYQRVKMTNFSLSCPLGVHSDLGAVKQCLLPNITPPELLQANSMVVLKSDIWGVGCQIYELLKGETVWSEHRHECREYIHKKISHNAPILPANITEEQSCVFRACWKPKPEDRYTTEKLDDYITSFLQASREVH